MKFIRTIVMTGAVALCAWQLAVAQDLTFTTNTYSTGSFRPLSLLAADVNGDGRSDLIFESYYPGFITVFTNNGGGKFGLNATYGTQAFSLLAADVNGDGAIDLISNDGLLLTNNGSGVFGSNSTLVTSFNSLVAADINGDGKPDLIGANAPFFVDTLNTLTVLTNDGNGVFSSNATLRVTGDPRFVTAADINGDGSLDVISREGNTLTIWTNNGSSVFKFNAILNVGMGYGCVLVADINADGKPDLITANDGGMNVIGSTLTVLTNNGSGVFGFNATLNVGSGPYWVVAADVNGDGKPDLITANGGNFTLTVLINETIFPAPALNIASTSPTNIVISWTSTLTGFTLQTNSDLTSTNWALADYFVSTNGLIKTISFSPPPAGNLFFRLKQ